MIGFTGAGAARRKEGETIEVIAQSVGISNLPADVSAALARDAEYRLRELMQVRRPSLCPCDYPKQIPVTSALRTLLHLLLPTVIRNLDLNVTWGDGRIAC
jgi:hypothetical protein